jgi:hypothetical protein
MSYHGRFVSTAVKTLARSVEYLPDLAQRSNPVVRKEDRIEAENSVGTPVRETCSCEVAHDSHGCTSTG